MSPTAGPCSQLRSGDSFGWVVPTQREAPKTGALLGLAGHLPSDRWGQNKWGLCLCVHTLGGEGG